METVEQQNALKDAMARAKEIAAKLKQSAPAPAEGEATSNEEPEAKKRLTEESEVSDPKLVAQQVTNNLVQRAGMGPMQVEEITIPNKIVGIVIGKGGEMINKLQNESGAKVQVSPNLPPEMGGGTGNHDRQITITGPAEAVNKAKAFISEIQALGKVPDHLMAGIEGEYSEEMMIPRNKVGLIIGKGGETIKSLQQQAGCKMVLIQDGLADDAMEKPLRLTGHEGNVMYAKSMIEDLVNSPDRVPGGRGPGGPGGPRGPRPPFNGGHGGPRHPWMGPGGPGGPGPRGPPRFRGPPALQPGFKDMIIEVPANRAGLVIGKGGETIRMIKGETNITINIDRNVPEESPFRVFRVQGTDEMIQQALAIIRDKTSDSSINARDEAGNILPEASYDQSHWGNQGNNHWGPPHDNQQWGGGQQYQGGWGQHQQGGWEQSQQHGGWNQPPQQPWGQQPPAWNQQSWAPQPPAPQQPWQPPAPAPAQWGAQPWGQPAAPAAPAPAPPAAVSAAPTAQAPAQAYQQPQPSQSSATAITSTTGTDTTQAATTATGQPDYSAAWALYYQQQQQYYQQYYAQQNAAAAAGTAAASTAAATAPASAAASATTAATTPATTSQAAAYAQYQAQLAEYQKKYGLQPTQ